MQAETPLHHADQSRATHPNISAADIRAQLIDALSDAVQAAERVLHFVCRALVDGAHFAEWR